MVVAGAGSLIGRGGEGLVGTVWLDNHLRLNSGFLTHAVLNSRVVDPFVGGVGAWAGDFDLRLIHAATNRQLLPEVVLGRLRADPHLHLIRARTGEKVKNYGERLRVRIGHI